MNWYLQSCENSDVVKSTRIRLSRNIHGFPFALAKKEQREAFENKIKEGIYAIGYGLQFLPGQCKIPLCDKCHWIWIAIS